MRLAITRWDKVFAAPLATFAVSFMRNRILLAIVVLSSIFSGCQGFAPVDQSKNEAIPSSVGNSMECENVSVSYWRINDTNRTQTWSPDTLRLGYGLPANMSVFFVAYENDTILGVNHVTTDEAVVADGSTLRLNSELSGSHTVHVKVYHDTNENGDFDSQSDSVCHLDGNEIRTRTATLNFSEFNSSSES